MKLPSVRKRLGSHMQCLRVTRLFIIEIISSLGILFPHDSYLIKIPNEKVGVKVYVKIKSERDKGREKRNLIKKNLEKLLKMFHGKE